MGVNGFGRVVPKPIQWLPCVQAEERENHPYWPVNPRTKELPEMNHHRWISISHINDWDVISDLKGGRDGK